MTSDRAPNENIGASSVEWGVATRPLSGESTIGDRSLVQTFEGGVLIAAVDGLGHGAEAAFAAQAAVDVLQDRAGDSIEQLVQRSHVELQGSRGVVMSVASLNLSDGLVTWAAVGNVEAVIVRPGSGGDGSASTVASVIPCPGIVGYKLPTLRPARVQMRPGDLAIFATDGVRPGFAEELHPLGTPQRIAERILETHGGRADDALVLVARLEGEA